MEIKPWMANKKDDRERLKSLLDEHRKQDTVDISPRCDHSVIFSPKSDYLID